MASRGARGSVTFNPLAVGGIGSPAGANGVVCTVSNGTLNALDTAGSIGCSGSPTTCSPLWSGGPGLQTTNASPAIVNGTVYLNSTTANNTWAYEL